jgi:Na(+)-translocating NADH:ubiquinone oxidoreductase B subunit
MRRLARLLAALRPLFEEGGRLRRLAPLFGAIEAFFFLAPARTAVAPHVRDPLDLKRYMSMVILAVAPCAVLGVYFFGLQVLVTIALAYLVGGTIEVLFAIARKEEVNEGFFVTGLLYPLILPPATPLWVTATGVAFGVVVGKELFGGTGRNPFNPALVGRCFVSLAYPATMAAGWVAPVAAWPGRLTTYVWPAGVDAVTAATPLGAAKQGAVVPAARLFWGNVAGSTGETSAAAILLGGAFLVLVGVANWRTIVAILGSFAATAAVLGRAGVQANSPIQPVGWELLAGGLLFGAVFMATDPVTGPITNGAKWVYGALVGVVAMLVRHLSGYPEGVTFAILLGNIVAPTLDEVFVRVRIRRLAREG